MTFASHLKAMMQTRNLTQTALSDLSGLSKASISQYLSNKNKPTDKAIYKLARALGCTADELNSVPQQSDDHPDIDTMKNIPIWLAARLLGKSEQFVRVSLQNKSAPFGFATKVSGNKYSYQISPKLFKEYQGGNQ